MVRSIAIGLVSATVLLSTANAADIYRASEAGGYKDGPVYAANTWTGFYVGGHIGYGRGDADVNIPAYPSPNHSQDGDGVVGGGHVGYNYQMGRFVIGVEGDFSGSDVRSSALSGNGGTELYKIDENWRASARGRLGYAFDRTLIYATGGAAFADVDVQYQPPAGGTKSKTLTGYTVGGGVEYALTPSWSIRGEYLFADFDSERFVHLGPSNVDYQTHEARFGVSYKFGPTYESLK